MHSFKDVSPLANDDSLIEESGTPRKNTVTSVSTTNLLYSAPSPSSTTTSLMTTPLTPTSTSPTSPTSPTTTTTLTSTQSEIRLISKDSTADLLRDREPEPEVKAETKAEVKPETKPEVKPEVKAEVKHETKADAKPETARDSLEEFEPDDKSPKKIKVFLAKFFRMRPTPKQLVEKKILLLDFHLPESKPIPIKLASIICLINRLEFLRATEYEGLFRVPGNALTVRELWSRLAEEPPPTFEDEVVSFERGPHEFAGALKLYFREAPQPLIPFHLYDVFIATAQLDPFDRPKWLAKSITCLTPDQKESLKILMQFLHKVTVNVATTKMEATNLAMIFGPSLMRKEEEDTMGLPDLSATRLQCMVVTTLIQAQNELFAEEEKIDQSMTVPNAVGPLGASVSPRFDEEDEESALLSRIEGLGGSGRPATMMLNRPRRDKNNVRNTTTIDVSVGLKLG
eukprot:TRINITY_DN5798_c0_g1_i1.p1 TRINITY_DN5798_c0_g1~~TRINITY_DN5798_c0_g1_i1.p1  ORF type:complete len:456 (-),score=115.67 TRINITY_DN5798_c0_g1_i1:42-1409(-)